LRQIVARIKGDKKDTELNKAEFKQVFELCTGKSLHGNDKGVDLDEIFASVDKDGSGTVSFEEMILWLAIYQKGDEDTKLGHMFDAFDSDHSGTLERSEITKVLDILKISMKDRGLSESTAISNATRLLQTLDVDKDQTISKAEWIKVGKEAHLVEELLGSEFMELMAEFQVK